MKIKPQNVFLFFIIVFIIIVIVVALSRYGNLTTTPFDPDLMDKYFPGWR